MTQIKIPPKNSGRFSEVIEVKRYNGHLLYEDGDADECLPVPEQALDRNGQVGLDVCILCGKYESGLNEKCEPFIHFSPPLDIGYDIPDSFIKEFK